MTYLDSILLTNDFISRRSISQARSVQLYCEVGNETYFVCYDLFLIIMLRADDFCCEF